MPALRPVQKRCTCEECISRDPKGVLIDVKALALHLHRVRQELTHQGNAVPHPPPMISPPDPSNDTCGLDEISGRLLALTITDEGLHPNSTTSKLWNTRDEFQSRCPSSDAISGHIKPLSTSDIAESLSRLTMHGDDQGQTPFPCDVPMPLKRIHRSVHSNLQAVHASCRCGWRPED